MHTDGWFDIWPGEGQVFFELPESWDGADVELTPQSDAPGFTYRSEVVKAEGERLRLYIAWENPGERVFVDFHVEPFTSGG